MKKILVALLTLGSALSFAGSDCKINAQRYDSIINETINTNIIKIYKLNTWEECYDKAVEVSQGYLFNEVTTKKSTSTHR